MSTFGGTSTENGTASDYTLQEAPTGDQGPDFGTLKNAFEACVVSTQPYCDQTRQNFRVRYALWDNQSADGKKHARQGNGQADVVPWDGASDLRVYMADEAINSKVAMLCTALRKANIVAVPIEGNDIKRAKTVSNLMRWIVKTQVPEIDRETELLANYINEKGIAATGQFWERREEKTLTNVSLKELAEAFPQLNLAELIYADEAADNICAIFEEVYGCSRAKAKKMLKELRSTQKTSVATVGRTINRPVIRAFNLDEDLFIPDSATDIETATGIYRVQYFSPEQLRAFVHSDNWNQSWVDQAIDRCKGRYISIASNRDNEPQARSFIYNQSRMTDKEMVGVVYAYQRLSDEDGVPGIYCTIFNPELPPNEDQPGYAKFGLLGYAHGQYPFVLHRREFLSRKLHDSRGIPEPAQPWQQQVKAHKDSRIDAASMAILPPMMYPAGRPPGRWGAGARVPERRAGEYHFADRPMPDMNTEKSEALLSESFNRYFGFVSRDTDPTFASLKNQNDVDKFMSGWAAALRQTWKLFNQFGSEEVFFRVIGLRQEEPMQFTKGDLSEDFDFYLNWDTQSMDAAAQEKKLEALAKICATFDKYGQIDYAEVLQLAVEIIDPNWAERVIQPKEVGSQRVVNETNTMLAQVFAGVDRDIDLNSPPELVKQTIQQYVQAAPDVQQRLQQDEAFKKRLEKLYKQADFQLTQQANAKIGRYGAG